MGSVLNIDTKFITLAISGMFSKGQQGDEADRCAKAPRKFRLLTSSATLPIKVPNSPEFMPVLD